MISKQMMIIVSASVIALGMAVTSTAFMTDASGQDSSEIKPSAPRYSETCAHGHNGFDCKPSSYRVDINDLQDRVAELEKRR